MVDDNKELVEKIAKSLAKLHKLPESCWVHCVEDAQAALSIILPELQKRDELLLNIITAPTMYLTADSISEARWYLLKIGKLIEDPLKTTTGHDSNGGGM